MSLPDTVQALACFLLPLPYSHLPAPVGRSPVLPTLACSDRRDVFEELGEDYLVQHRPGKPRILHLDALQGGPANGESREVQPAQVAAQLFEQAEDISRTIALGRCILGTELREQAQQMLLDLCICSQFGAQPLEKRMHQQAHLDLSHIVLGLRLSECHSA